MEFEERIREAFTPIRNASGVRSIKHAAQRPTKTLRIVGLAAAVTAASLIAVLVTLGVPESGQRDAQASTMLQLAQVVRSEPRIVVEDGQYLYSVTLGRRENCVGEGPNDCRWEKVRREMWASTDGSGRMAGSSQIDGSWSELMGPGELGGSLNQGIPPTDPDELQAFIEARASMADQPLHWEMFVVLTDLLGETFSSPILYSQPELRASLFEVAASLPGVEDLGRMTDDIGREGVGFGFTGANERMELIFDPETAVILQMRQVPVPAPDEGPRVDDEGWTLFLEVGVVDSVRERP